VAFPNCVFSHFYLDGFPNLTSIHKGSHQKIKSPKVGTLSQQGGGGSDQMGRMSQPVLFGSGRVCPHHFFWSLEHIRCPKFGRGAGGQQRLGQCPKFGTFYFLMASLSG
jgi:hypothetical protein